MSSVMCIYNCGWLIDRLIQRSVLSGLKEKEEENNIQARSENWTNSEKACKRKCSL